MVKAWRETVVIPTYEIGTPEKNPIFLEKRVYQGSSGVVYPYPVIESISDEKVDKEWHAVWLENEYIKVMILPELGGRVQMAYDKIKKRHFVYYNHVIKPALVGLTGPWISGGIEFNWPQHHRPSTYLPVDSTIEENEDGSVTVWVNEIEKMFHQKGMAGFTLRPGKAYLEIKGRVYNPTNIPQTFLWWANPAVAVNDYYQSVFPQDINAVFDHGKRAVSSFPIATGTYYKMDYSAGVDISNYKNIKVPTSYMGVNSKFDFEGGYENDTKAGMLHVANHHVSPGKKQWTWGNGDFGQAWDRNLTDADGPYIELMAGVFTENQPDFSWLMPYEEKRFTQYFMPYRELGVVKAASKDFIMNINMVDENGNPTEQSTGKVNLKVFATSKQTVEVFLGKYFGASCYHEKVDISPENILDVTVDVGDKTLDELSFSISSLNGRQLLAWHAEPDEIRPIPDPAEAALLPEQIKSIDQLYLTGLHLEQYRHATYNPVDYYEEALRRDPMDYRCNNALGLWYLRKCRFDKAEEYLRRAVKVLMKRNPNPYDGEPLYNLGLVLKYRHRIGEAYDMFYKSTWNAAWQDAGFFACAELSVVRERLDDAEEEIENCLIRNSHNHRARGLKATILRMQGRTQEALDWCEASLALDRFNYHCIYEQYLLTNDKAYLDQMIEMMHGMPNNYMELAIEYMEAGCMDDAVDILNIAIANNAATPMTYYYLGYLGDNSDYEKAEQMPADYCFPNRAEDVVVLEAIFADWEIPAKEVVEAMIHGGIDPENYTDESSLGSKVCYYLGCLYYDKRQYDLATYYWMISAVKDHTFPTVWRNLALAMFNKLGNKKMALRFMEKAFSLDTTDARILMELDQLYKRVGKPHAERLAHLQKYPELIAKRDDLLLEEITLLNQTGHYEEAMKKLDAHQFHPWEGGEGKVSGQYQLSRLELAKIALKDAKKILLNGKGLDNQSNGKDAEALLDRAIMLLNECLVYPHHLGEGKLYGAQENDFYYFLGCAYEMKDDMDKAKECWETATFGPQEPAAAMYYNDAKPDKIFYQGLALLKLGRKDEAHGRFYKLVNYGKNHLFEKVVMDYFAVSLPDLQIWEGDLDVANQIHCKYMLALGYYGLGDMKHAKRYLDEAAELDVNHLGILSFKTWSNM